MIDAENRRLPLWIGIIVAVVWSLAPYAWFISTSLKSPVEITGPMPI